MSVFHFCNTAFFLKYNYCPLDRLCALYQFVFDGLQKRSTRLHRLHYEKKIHQSIIELIRMRISLQWNKKPSGNLFQVFGLSFVKTPTKKSIGYAIKENKINPQRKFWKKITKSVQWFKAFGIGIVVFIPFK